MFTLTQEADNVRTLYKGIKDYKQKQSQNSSHSKRLTIRLRGRLAPNMCALSLEQYIFSVCVCFLPPDSFRQLIILKRQWNQGRSDEEDRKKAMPQSEWMLDEAETGGKGDPVMTK